jgi:hypothetical protein
VRADDAGRAVPMRNDRTNVLVTWIRSLSSGTKLGEGEKESKTTTPLD